MMIKTDKIKKMGGKKSLLKEVFDYGKIRYDY